MPTRSRLRRLAACVLMVWLFGLVSGIVNACVLGSDARHAADDAIAAVHEHEHEHEPGMTMAESAGLAGLEHPPAHGKPPCERLCDAPAAARSAGNELGSVLAGLWLAPAPLPSMTMRAVETAASPTPRARLVWHPGIPLPIAFLRLTL